MPDKNSSNKASVSNYRPSSTWRTRGVLLLFGMIVAIVVFIVWPNYDAPLPTKLEEKPLEMAAKMPHPLPAAGKPGSPSVHSYRVVKKYPHDPKAFTQGLFWLNGSLYESLGLFGQSGVREVRLEDGAVMREVKNPDEKKDFGEGVVHTGNGEMLQILWQTGRGYRFSAQAGEGGHLRMDPPHIQTPLNDGWGLEYDGKELIVSDSGPELYFMDPKTFKMSRQVDVTDDGKKIEMVNELEYINGEVWANLFGMDCIARIQPETGEVIGWVMFEGLLDRRAESAAAQNLGRQPPDVFNGIAWDAEQAKLYVTGKLWPTLFEVEIIETKVTLAEARQFCIPRRNIFRQR